MSPHAVNSLVTDLVQMAQAMEKVPQLELDLEIASGRIVTLQESLAIREADLEQSRTYAASLEAKVHAAEASRDDAELRFLELDEKVHLVLDTIRGCSLDLGQVASELSPMPQLEPIVSEVKPIVPFANEPITERERAEIEAIPMQPQGQSEADPIAVTEPQGSEAAAQNGLVPSTIDATTTSSWATSAPSKPQPYAGKTWTEIAATANHYIGYNEWKEGGGSDENWNS